MISRIALLIASLATAATLMVALAAAGFAPGSSQPVPAAITTSPASPVSPVVAADPTPPAVQVDTIYLAPVPVQKTITVQRLVASAGGEGGESEEGVEVDD
jgi:hypothetical protein